MENMQKLNLSYDIELVLLSYMQAEKERIKSLSMFGKLVSPKLRATQSSFEKGNIAPSISLTFTYCKHLRQVYRCIVFE